MAAAALATAIATSVIPLTHDGRVWPVHQDRQLFAARPVAVLEEQPPPVNPAVMLAGPGPTSGGCSSGPVHDIIVSYGWEDSVALAVADRESHCNAGAVNGSSGTSGVFQLAPFWWDGSSAFGWVFDPLDAAQNVAHAFLIYQYEGGWAPAWCANIAGLYDPPGC